MKGEENILCIIIKLLCIFVQARAPHGTMPSVSWNPWPQATTYPDSMVSGMFAARRYRSRWSQEKAYVCSYPGCGKAFFHVHNLQRHQKAKHEGIACKLVWRYRSRFSTDKTYVCPYPGCGKTFFHVQNLDRHQRDKHGVICGKINNDSQEN